MQWSPWCRCFGIRGYKEYIWDVHVGNAKSSRVYCFWMSLLKANANNCDLLLSPHWGLSAGGIAWEHRWASVEVGTASCTASPARQTWARWPCWSWCPPAQAKGNLQVRLEVDLHLDLCTLVCQLDYWHRCFVQHLKVVSFRNQWTKHVIDSEKIFNV